MGAVMGPRPTWMDAVASAEAGWRRVLGGSGMGDYTRAMLPGKKNITMLSCSMAQHAVEKLTLGRLASVPGRAAQHQSLSLAHANAYESAALVR